MQKHLRISFEFFPAKTAAGTAALMQAITQLSQVQPDFFSVTYGAGGSTHEGTVSLVKHIAQVYEANVAPHITCIGAQETQLLAMLKQYQALNIRRIVALRGDMSEAYALSQGIDSAAKLITFIRHATGNHFHIEAAAYPECHPKSLSVTADLENFKAKVLAGANSAITQYFYNPDAYFYFLDLCAKHQIFVPIVPGIMPITNHEKLVRFSQLCGAEIPKWILKRLEDYAQDESALKAFGFEVTQQLCERLIAGGAPGLHFYTLNTAHTTLKLLQSLGLNAASQSHRILTVE